MSLSPVTVNILFIFTALFLASGVYPKTTSDESQQPSRFRSCTSSSYCTPIKKCSSFRDGWKRRGVGITCGHGSGHYRRVCCPRIQREEVLGRQSNRLIEENSALPAASKKSEAASDDSDQPNRFSTCDAWSYCTPIKKCSSFRDGWKRRGVGITCGHGSGPYRMVCCTRTSREEVLALQANHLTTNIPAPLTDSKSNGARQTNRLNANSSAPPTDSKSNRGCGISQGVDWFKEHMANGEDELEATWPWMVAIKMRKYQTGIWSHCSSGVLLDKKHVLTTASCYSPPRWEKHELPITVHVGSDDYELGKVYPVSKVKVHEDFRPWLRYNNIAILTLEREVDVPNFVPICLPDKRLEGKDLTGWGATFVGWGTEKRNVPQSSVLMQMDDIPIVSNRECNQLYKEFNERSFPIAFPGGITREIMCAGKTEGSRDICKGTGGSPLMILDRKRWFVVGLSSFHHYCGQNHPSGHTNVLYHVDWIKQNIKD